MSSGNPSIVKPPLYGLPPLIVTEQELVSILGPLTMGYAWGNDTIGDLWRMGAPDLSNKPGQPIKRIVFPGQLGKWLSDVLERQGRPLSQAAQVYLDIQEMS